MKEVPLRTIKPEDLRTGVPVRSRSNLRQVPLGTRGLIVDNHENGSGPVVKVCFAGINRIFSIVANSFSQFCSLGWEDPEEKK
jgi:hypothetical protein